MVNKFKFGALRQFGSENFSFNAEVESENPVLTSEEIKAQIKQMDSAITEAFIQVQEREISEKDILADASDRRKVAVKKLDDALKLEMEVKEHASKTMREAEKKSDKITKAK